MRRILERPYAVGERPERLGTFAEPALVDRGSSRRNVFHAVSTRVYQVDTSSPKLAPTSPESKAWPIRAGPGIRPSRQRALSGPDEHYYNQRQDRSSVDWPIHIRGAVDAPVPQARLPHPDQGEVA